MNTKFSKLLIAWQRRFGRHDLPWQQTRDPYAIWLAEIMLQQTRVQTVLPYYKRFITRFPRLADLAAAKETEILELWSGLGYYARARNLHKSAQKFVADYAELPSDPRVLEQYPGIGRSTAQAIAAFAFGTRYPILDANVVRVLSRAFAIGGTTAVRTPVLWKLAEDLLPQKNVAAYLQAQMDLGSQVCTSHAPLCTICPLKKSCRAWREGTIENYPQPKPRTLVPRRTGTVLLLCDGKHILLEQRPSRGLWGGLLTLPELPQEPICSPVMPLTVVTTNNRLAAAQDHATALGKRIGRKIGRIHPLPPLEHRFTHFHLTIFTYAGKAEHLLHTKNLGNSVAKNRAFPTVPANMEALQWLALNRVAKAHLPSPIRRLISTSPYAL